MKINNKIHFNQLSIDEMRPSLNYIYFFDDYCYITDSYVLMKIHQFDFFGGFVISQFDTLNNKMVKIKDVAMLYNKRFKIENDNFVFNDSISIKIYSTDRTDFKPLSKESFEKLLNDDGKDPKKGHWVKTRHFRKAINLYTGKLFEFTDKGTFNKIKFTDSGLMENVEIICMNAYQD